MSSVDAEMTNTSSDVFPYTFTEIIDADHLCINRLAGKVRRLLASSNVSDDLPELRHLLLEITWRLIRHDFSEDVVMRPAFISVLDERGIQMAAEDRAEHIDGRNALLRLSDMFRELESDRTEEERVNRLEEASRMTLTTFDQFAEHMRVESGEFLPYFESVISASMSRTLARGYADTLIMTPGLKHPFIDGHSTGDVVFEAGIDEYIHLDQQQLKEIHSGLLELRRTNTGAGVWFDEIVQRELKQMRIEKQREKKEKGATNTDIRQNDHSKKNNVPTNPLGLPLRWDRSTKGKL